MEKNFLAWLASAPAGHPRHPDPGDPARAGLGRGAPRPAGRRSSLHPFLEVGLLAGLEAGRPGPRRQPAAGLYEGAGRGKPRAFILENVYALTYKNQASCPAFERLLHEIDEAGYRCPGGPQRRRLRSPSAPAAVVRRRVTRARPFPSCLKPPTAAVGTRSTGAGPTHVTTGEALAVDSRARAREVLRGKWGHLLPEIPRARTTFTSPRNVATQARLRLAESVLVVPAEAGPRSSVTDDPGPARSERRSLPLGKPSPSGRRVGDSSPSLMTRLAARRGASVQAQIGNAVPPLLAQRVADQVISTIYC